MMLAASGLFLLAIIPILFILCSIDHTSNPPLPPPLAKGGEGGFVQSHPGDTSPESSRKVLAKPPRPSPLSFPYPDSTDCMSRGPKAIDEAISHNRHPSGKDRPRKSPTVLVGMKGSHSPEVLYRWGRFPRRSPLPGSKIQSRMGN